MNKAGHWLACRTVPPLAPSALIVARRGTLPASDHGAHQVVSGRQLEAIPPTSCSPPPGCPPPREPPALSQRPRSGRGSIASRSRSAPRETTARRLSSSFSLGMSATRVASLTLRSVTEVNLSGNGMRSRQPSITKSPHLASVIWCKTRRAPVAASCRINISRRLERASTPMTGRRRWPLRY